MNVTIFMWSLLSKGLTYVAWSQIELNAIKQLVYKFGVNNSLW